MIERRGIKFPTFVVDAGASNVKLLTCSRCYALVSMPDEHAAWHQQLTDTLQSHAVVALAAADAAGALTDEQRERYRAELAADAGTRPGPGSNQIEG